MRIKQKLLSGRVLGLIATLSGLSFCAASFSANSSYSPWLLAVGILGMIFCTVGTIWWMKTSYSSLKSLLSRGSDDAKVLQTQLHESALHLESLQTEQNELARSLRHFRKQVNSELASIEQGLNLSNSEIRPMHFQQAGKQLTKKWLEEPRNRYNPF